MTTREKGICILNLKGGTPLTDLRRESEQLLTRLAQLPRHELMDPAYVAEVEAFGRRLQGDAFRQAASLMDESSDGKWYAAKLLLRAESLSSLPAPPPQDKESA